MSFLASRASPTAGFWIALAGGAALARAGALWGNRRGYGASIAAMLETVAVMGPARFGVPLTQALSAPLLGSLDREGASVLRQVLACAAIRLVQNAVFVAFFILVLAGGLDAYTDTYDSVTRWLFLPDGAEGALILTGIALLGWAAFASIVQVLVYRRGLRLTVDAGGGEPRAVDAPDGAVRRFDPRAVALASALAFTILLTGTGWPLLAAVAAWLAVVWAVCDPDRAVVPAGLLIALTLGAGVLVFGLVGGAGLDTALRRTVRAVLLVVVATWLRAAAGAAGMREVSRRALGRLRRLPAVGEAAVVLDDLGSERALGNSARGLLASLRAVPKRPMPVLDAVLEWVSSESARFRASPSRAAPALRLRARDVALVALAAAPVAAALG